LLFLEDHTAVMKFKLYLFLFSVVAFNCQPNTPPPNNPASVPTVTTTAINSITSTTALGGGNVTVGGGATVSARGICWSSSANPVVTGPHTTDGTGTGVFTSSITGLTPNTVYYVRAYATNSSGTSYGAELNFTTSPGPPGLASLTTTAVTSITNSGAVSGGTITGDGGASITSRGLCWGLTANPSITGTHTIDGTGTGTFISVLSGLNANTTYFIRAFATNSAGTTYGNELSFTTSPNSYVIPNLTTIAVTSITSNSASSGGNIISDGGTTVTARGVCWSTTTNPVISGNHTTDGSGTGSFTSSITGLTANTNYFVRSYATNSVGTAYGNQISFTTSPPPVVDVYVTGFENTSSLIAPKYWKNGTATTLPTRTSGGGEGHSVFVSGNDVYVAGEDSGSAAIWKNGSRTILGGYFSNAPSVFVSGSDVYAAGYEYPGITGIATLWKNNVLTNLTNGTQDARAYSVFVAGNDVYVAGYESNGTNHVAKIWKNGIPTSLTNGVTSAHLYSIYVVGTDVYATGEEHNGTFMVAKVWKNGVPTILGSSLSNGRSVYVSGSDVYVAGYELSGGLFIAKYWKNGIATPLTTGVNDAVAFSISVMGSDVYVAGSEKSGANYKVMLWKNGVANSITNGTFNAGGRGVFVK
jgi:hypothetical protein